MLALLSCGARNLDRDVHIVMFSTEGGCDARWGVFAFCGSRYHATSTRFPQSTQSNRGYVKDRDLSKLFCFNCSQAQLQASASGLEDIGDLPLGL